jgi:hypothetical protein
LTIFASVCASEFLRGSRQAFKEGVKEGLVWVCVVDLFSEVSFLLMNVLEFVVPEVVFVWLLVVNFADGF